MKTKLLIGLLILSMLLLVGCDDSPSTFDVMKQKYFIQKERADSMQDDINELHSKLYHSFPKKDLAYVTDENCYVIVNEGGRPHPPLEKDYDIRPIRIWDLEKGSIEKGFDLADWKYYLACYKKFR